MGKGGSAGDAAFSEFGVGGVGGGGGGGGSIGNHHGGGGVGGGLSSALDLEMLAPAGCYATLRSRMTGRAKTLLVMIFLFLTITGAQYVAGTIANSLALQADCLSMLVDAISYMGSLVAECVRHPMLKERLQLGMSGASIILLAVFTILFLEEGVANLTAPPVDPNDPGEVEEEVNPWIVLGFALAGLLFDAVSLAVYFCCGRGKRGDETGGGADVGSGLDSDAQEMLLQEEEEEGAGMAMGVNGGTAAATSPPRGGGHRHLHYGGGGAHFDVPDEPMFVGGVGGGRNVEMDIVPGHGRGRGRGRGRGGGRGAGAGAGGEEELDGELGVGARAGTGGGGARSSGSASGGSTSRINMLAALGHVLSDLARSLTTLVEGIVLLTVPALDSVIVDGVSAVVVCSLISIGTLVAIYAWIKAFRKYQRTSRLGTWGGGDASIVGDGVVGLGRGQQHGEEVRGGGGEGGGGGGGGGGLLDDDGLTAASSSPSSSAAAAATSANAGASAGAAESTNEVITEMDNPFQQRKLVDAGASGVSSTA